MFGPPLVMAEVLSLAVPRWKRVTERTDHRKGADSNLPGWQPKEKEDLTAKAGPTASTTPLLRDAQKPWGRHPP